jgi:Cadherin domain.
VCWSRSTGWAVLTYPILTPSPLFCSQVQLRILDRNDSPPSFADFHTEYTISEDVPVGTLVAKVKAIDPDLPGTIAYSLVAGDEGKFVLESSSGNLKLKDTLDREQKDKYRVQVRASDGVQSADVVLTILVSVTIYLLFKVC